MNLLRLICRFTATVQILVILASSPSFADVCTEAESREVRILKQLATEFVAKTIKSQSLWDCFISAANFEEARADEYIHLADAMVLQRSILPERMQVFALKAIEDYFDGLASGRNLADSESTLITRLQFFIARSDSSLFQMKARSWLRKFIASGVSVSQSAKATQNFLHNLFGIAWRTASKDECALLMAGVLEAMLFSDQRDNENLQNLKRDFNSRLIANQMNAKKFSDIASTSLMALNEEQMLAQADFILEFNLLISRLDVKEFAALNATLENDKFITVFGCDQLLTGT